MNTTSKLKKLTLSLTKKLLTKIGGGKLVLLYKLKILYKKGKVK